MADSINLKIALILTFGFAFAALLGYFSHRIKLSPIFGYLIAGYLIGPFSPGFVGDKETAEQLSEIGVLLMMFSAGMHFKWQDLVKVRRIAIPGAIGQTLVATVIATFVMLKVGWSMEAGIIFGLAIGVASTMVLIRVLSDNELLTTREGYVAVGWLVVEDLITVIILLLIPALVVYSQQTELLIQEIAYAVIKVLLKFILLASLMFTLGYKLVTFLLKKIKMIQYPELFTLTILAITFAIAIGSNQIFGTSIALGAFLAGMVMGQTRLHNHVYIKITPLKDAFVVIFFLSVGMLFNPVVIVRDFPLFLATLAIILIAKPLAAFAICILLRHRLRTAATVGLGLAQIGEFSFILSAEAMRYNLLPATGYDLIVASALVTISINPLLFKMLRAWEKKK
ncbi:MAG TPA: cation:proton antiporter [Rhabdochlamydiaceae bacterium]|jgi:CPA2 family monovalent cation:H+ antiporter-2